MAVQYWASIVGDEVHFGKEGEPPSEVLALANIVQIGVRKFPSEEIRWSWMLNFKRGRGLALPGNMIELEELLPRFSQYVSEDEVRDAIEEVSSSEEDAFRILWTHPRFR